MKPVRVLVVDDSPTMRSLIAHTLSRHSGLEVVGQAGDALEARAAIKALNPDVMTLDVEMPNMNGLDFLEKVMRLRPMPVVMVSTLTRAGADATLEALELGAVDCIAKPSVSDPEAFAGLPMKVIAAAHAQVRAAGEPLAAAPVRAAPPTFDPGRVIAIGASTGGVEALLRVLSIFPKDCPPTLVTQHMPAAFTPSFAARLDRACQPKVREAEDDAPLAPGLIYLAPGGVGHLELAGREGAWRCRIRRDEPVNGHRPSVDVMFSSVARTAGARAAGAVLTGMGRDGAAGLLEMRRAGAATFGQDESSSVIYGMPRAAFEMGAVQRQLPLGRIGADVLRACEAPAAGVARSA
jgi:two-component system, chemotaxis family, protein-glutamate methylesterase/glutaminase